MPMQKKHVAVVGAGPWGRNLARNFHALGALRLVCDVDKRNREAALSRYDGIEVTASFQTVLDNPAIDAVVIATPAGLHAAMARDTLLAGKDVFVEKPLALSAAEGEEVVRLAEQRDRVLMVGHLLWYHPAILKLKRLIDQGELGPLRYLYSQRTNLGRVRREENILWSFAPHDISIILGLLGSMPERIQAQGGYYLRPEVADVTVTWLTFKNGVCAHVFVSWLHPYKEQRLVVIGEHKMAVFDDLAPEKLLLYPYEAVGANLTELVHRAAESVPVENIEPLRAECEHFLECIHSRRRPRTDGQEALRVLSVLGSCQEALAEQRLMPQLLHGGPVAP